MGKKLDALLGRGFKPSKFKTLTNLAMSRLSVFKNQRQVRCNQARSDVLQLLELGHHDRALLRVEQVIKEMNMLDVFIILEGYCNLVVERLHLIEQDKVCPDEIKEAISGLVFASSRCGDFPELQEIRAVFVSRYGKEFAARAIELRNNCGVNSKIIQKLSTKQPDLQSKMNMLKQIAAENGIALQLEETTVSSEENLDDSKKQSQPKQETSVKASDDEEFSDSRKTKKKYKDVADAAQAAFESAAYAAAAARAAVELSRSDSYYDDDDDDDDQDSPNTQRKMVSDKQEANTEYKENHGNQAEELSQSKKTTEIMMSSPSSEGSPERIIDFRTMSLDEVDPIKLLEKEVVIFDSDDDKYDSHGSSSDLNTRKLKGKAIDTKKDDEHSKIELD